MVSSFTWIQVYKAICNKLLEYENKQHELITLLKSLGITGFSDEDASGKIELSELDPFTFLNFINKYGADKRLNLTNRIAEKLGLNGSCIDTDGIPSVFGLNVWMFPFKKERDPNLIPFLWDLFKQALAGNVNANDFQKILTMKGMGKAKITACLFFANPDTYLPINKQTEDYLSNNGINPNFKNLEEYLDISIKAKEKFNKPLYQISYEGWLETSSQEQGVSEPQIQNVYSDFKPGMITGEHVIFAAKKIDEEEEAINEFSAYAVLINDKHYPVLDILRIAHGLATGNALWKLKEGEASNQVLENLGFDVVENALDTSSQRKYWKISPDEQAKRWPEFLNKKMMAVSFKAPPIVHNVQ